MIIAFFEKHTYIGKTIEWGFAILCCAHMPRKIPKQRGGLNFVDPEISIYLTDVWIRIVWFLVCCYVLFAEFS